MGGLRYFPVRGKKRWLLGLAVPIVAAVIRDLANPAGFIRQACAAFFPATRTAATRRLKKQADFSIVENTSGQSNKKEKIS
jgi:hypothetical protein